MHHEEGERWKVFFGFFFVLGHGVDIFESPPLNSEWKIIEVGCGNKCGKAFFSLVGGEDGSSRGCKCSDTNAKSHSCL